MSIVENKNILIGKERNVKVSFKEIVRKINAFSLPLLGIYLECLLNSVLSLWPHVWLFIKSNALHWAPLLSSSIIKDTFTSVHEPLPLFFFKIWCIVVSFSPSSTQLLYDISDCIISGNCIGQIIVFCRFILNGKGTCLNCSTHVTVMSAQCSRFVNQNESYWVVNRKLSLPLPFFRYKMQICPPPPHLSISLSNTQKYTPPSSSITHSYSHVDWDDSWNHSLTGWLSSTILPLSFKHLHLIMSLCQLISNQCLTVRAVLLQI